MLWFRVGEQVTGFITFAFTFGILYSVISMMVIGADSKSMHESPSLNGTFGVHITIILLQIWVSFTCIYGFFVAFKVWKNNYQMDKQIRHWFIIWLASWFGSLLTNVAVAIYAILKGKEPQDEMVYISEVFSKHSNDKKFVASFERYQRENVCCGIYGPDDWMLIQLRSSPNAGGGGGGYRSLDYGFQTNPSTGHCHMSHPTIPMGCGKKILEEVHIKLSTHAGLVILECVVGIIAGVLAWYCFFYWLEKEVIVIPEDEVSNLIIIEPESSTSTVVDHVYGDGGNYPPGGPHSAGYILHDPGYGPSRMPRASYYSSDLGKSRSYNHHYPSGYPVGSQNHHHTGSRNHNSSGSQNHYLPGTKDNQKASQKKGINTKQILGSIQQSSDDTPVAVTNNPLTTSKKSQLNPGSKKSQLNPGSKKSQLNPASKKSQLNPASKKSQLNPASNKSQLNPALMKIPHKSKSKKVKVIVDSPALHPVSRRTLIKPTTTKLAVNPNGHNMNPLKVKTQRLLSVAGPYDANSRFRVSKESHPGYIQPHRAKYYIRQPYHENPPVSAVGLASKGGYLQPLPIASIEEPKMKHSHNHMLHKQELALGGKLLGEMHIDHAKDEEPMNPKTDAAKGEQGHREHHATVAIVRNKKTPQPKTIMPQQNKIAGGHHGQTGHLAEDIVVMSGKKAKKLVDDIILPVEHNPPPGMGNGGYLTMHKKREPVLNSLQAEGVPEGVAHLTRGNKISAPAVDGSQAQNLLEVMIAPKTEAQKKFEKDLPKAHYVGAVTPHTGRYLPTGAPGQHNQNNYLHTHPIGYLPMGAGGSRENGEHGNAHYLPEHRGAHERGHYLPEHLGEHERGHYLPEHQGEHERGHYLPEHQGEHERGHYLPEYRGEHERGHYLPEHQGEHERGRYLPEHQGEHERGHYLPEHRGEHERGHYLPEHQGEYERGRYLPEHQGEHERGHYLPEHHGEHERGHYLPEHHGEHERGHYLSEHRGEHERGHYLPEHRGRHERGHYLPEHQGEHERGHYL